MMRSETVIREANEKDAADLARLASFAAEPEARYYLENLVARAYAEIHGARAENRRFRPWVWFSQTFPQTWRRNARTFWLASGLMIVKLLSFLRYLDHLTEAVK